MTRFSPYHLSSKLHTLEIHVWWFPYNSPYEVFLQAYEDAKVWVSDFKSDAFLVCSDKPLVRFAWEIKAKRRGYESERLVKQGVDNAKVAEIFEPEKFKEKEVEDIDGNVEVWFK